MQFTRILIHAVWTTKDRKKYLIKDAKEKMITHIKEYALTKNIDLENINGHHDHLHCIIDLKPEQTVSSVIQLIKGESSFWANRNLKSGTKFGWHDQYLAVSVSQSQLQELNDYLNRQELIHKTKTYQQEYDEFLIKFKFRKG